VFVVASLFLLIALRDGAEAAVADVTYLLPLGYAFAAGMVASVNPCGFFLLPSYVSYHLGTEEAGFEQSPVVARLARSLLLGGVATLGFIVVFASVGAVVATGGRWLITVFPYAGLSMGIGMILLGLWLGFTGRTIGIAQANRLMVAPKRNLWNVFLFGLGYAVGSLSCTLPVFLVVVGTAVVTQGLAASFGQFIGYALGMGFVLMGVTLGVSLFKGAVTAYMRAIMPYLHRVSTMFLIGAGSYLIYYWVFYADFF
jgi:cytochrome c biogenesis protein CcdA